MKTKTSSPIQPPKVSGYKWVCRRCVRHEKHRKGKSVDRFFCVTCGGTSVHDLRKVK